MTLKLLNWYLHSTISSAQLIIKNIRFNPVLWETAHYGTAVNYADLYYLKKQIVRLPMAQKRRRKSVAMHNFSTSHFSVPCINDATKTLIGLRQHISLVSVSRVFIFHFCLNNGEHLFSTQPKGTLFLFTKQTKKSKT